MYNKSRASCRRVHIAPLPARSGRVQGSSSSRKSTCMNVNGVHGALSVVQDKAWRSAVSFLRVVLLRKPILHCPGLLHGCNVDDRGLALRVYRNRCKREGKHVMKRPLTSFEGFYAILPANPAFLHAAPVTHRMRSAKPSSTRVPSPKH